MLLDRRVTRRGGSTLCCWRCASPASISCLRVRQIYTTASQAGMVVAALPLAVVVAAWLLLGERPHRRVWIGFVLAVVGVVWLSAGSEATESAPNPIFGNFLEVLAMLCGALYVVCAKQLSSRCSPVLITTMQSLIGLLFFLCLLPLPAVKLPDSFPLLPTLAILYLGVGVTMLSFLLYNFAVRSVPASRTGAFLNLVPVLTLFMGMVFLDERLTAGQWAASALVFGGVILSQWKRRSRRKRQIRRQRLPFRKVRNERKRAFAGASCPRRRPGAVGIRHPLWG
ncbi:MAG: DMT family transporter [Bilophila wadsworthia]